MTDGRTVIILAAGEGKRMKSALPKMLHPLLGRTLLGHVLTATTALHPSRRIVVVGHGADQLTAHLAEIAPDAVTVLQDTAARYGTRDPSGRWRPPARPRAPWSWSTATSRCCGRARSARLVEAHEAVGAAATILTADVENPYGLGRVIRNPVTGAVDAIVEERDATPDQRAITEINAGVYAFEAALLAQALCKLTTKTSRARSTSPT